MVILALAVYVTASVFYILVKMRKIEDDVEELYRRGIISWDR